MYSHDIKQLLEMKNYLITVKEYVKIYETSPQITEISYNGYDDAFNIKTKDNYDLKFKIKKEDK